MARTNGRSEIEPDHELPASEDTDQDTVTAEPAAVIPPVEGELGKLRAERDSLLERLARLQAEFENARKRAAREQQEYRDYALTDALKTLLPVLDSFDRALQTSTDNSELRSGVELIYKQISDALQKLDRKAHV